MAGRRTNLALLWLLAATVATGGLAFAVGVPWGRWVVAAHGVSGLAIVLLAPWKSVVVRRGLRRMRPGSGVSVAFAVLVAGAIAFGVAHAAGLRALGGVTTMQLHVGLALLSVPFALWHVLARRVRMRRTDLSRRNLLRAGALLGVTGAAYAATEGLLRAAGLPGGDRRFTGSHERGSFRPEAMPVTQWLDDAVPSLDPEAWRLEVRAGGAVRRWTYEEVAAFDDRVRATLDCTGGWFATQDWEGVWLGRLLPRGAAGRSLGFGSATGYGRRLPFGDLGRLLLATRVGGRPLSPGHGFPARLVVPGRRGFWWVKWVTSVEVTDTPWWWQAPFPVT